jgi:dinuclear metal center YbgI/SA1388 family protein
MAGTVSCGAIGEVWVAGPEDPASRDHTEGRRMTELTALAAYCDALLNAAAFEDYCPNGLQVEGDRPVRRLASGVTASAALLDQALAWGADAVLVHHGWFWRGEDPRLVGMKGQRVRTLTRAGLGLLAYHLPLDAHPEFGNNRQLAEVLGLCEPRATDRCGGILWQGRLPRPMTVPELSAHIAASLGRAPVQVQGQAGPIDQVAWCTGAAQDYIEQAAALGVDAYLSGEISEQTTHQARELGLDYFALGHHASERYGVRALGGHLAVRFALDHRFIDIDNPA